MLRLIALVGGCLLAGIAEAASVEFKVVDTKGQPIPDAIVSLSSTDGTTQAATPIPAVEIVQNGQEFLPFVTAIRTGTTVLFPNQDSVQHHIYSLSKPKKFELPLYRPGQAESMTFDQPGVVVLGCNIHDWMSAYVVVLDTPWFAKTSAAGTTTIAAVTSGTYRAEVWHPRLAKSETRDVAIADAGGTESVLTFTLALKPDRRIRRSPEAPGGGYK